MKRNTSSKVNSTRMKNYQSRRFRETLNEKTIKEDQPSTENKKSRIRHLERKKYQHRDLETFNEEFQ